MGLMDSAYWLSWWAFELAVALLNALLVVGLGRAFTIELFAETQFSLCLVVVFLGFFAITAFGLTLTSLARAPNATAGWVVFFAGWLMGLVVVFGFPYDGDYATFWQVLFALFPWTLLTKAFQDLDLAANTAGRGGMTWADAGNCLDDTLSVSSYGCPLPVGRVLWAFAAQIVAYLALQVYLDNVVPDAMGLRQPPLYFLGPSYWLPGRFKRGNARAAEALGAAPAPAPGGDAAPGTDTGVVEAEAAMRRECEDLATGRVPAGAAAPVRVFGLRKEFPVSRRARRESGGRLGSTQAAVEGLWLGVGADTCLCVLGPNGAGKTTAINCLTGQMGATRGELLVCGHSVGDPAGLAAARRCLGVCPQFDVLHEGLTGRENLELFAYIRGVPRAARAGAVGEALGAVRLLDAADVPSGAYSGGMRRRLSVAAALLGGPRVIVLDEPTTGMDPVSRRHVWALLQVSAHHTPLCALAGSLRAGDRRPAPPRPAPPRPAPPRPIPRCVVPVPRARGPATLTCPPPHHDAIGDCRE